MSCETSWDIFFKASDPVARTCEGSDAPPIVRYSPLDTHVRDTVRDQVRAPRPGVLWPRAAGCGDWGRPRSREGPSRSGGGPRQVPHIIVFTKLLVPGVRVRSYVSRNPHMADGGGVTWSVTARTGDGCNSPRRAARLHVAMFTRTGCVQACALWGGAHISGDAGPGGHVSRGLSRKRALFEISRKHASASQMPPCPFGAACIRVRTADRARARADHERAKVRARAQGALARLPEAGPV